MKDLKIFTNNVEQEIVENVRDTIDILEIIKPVYNFKASGA